MSAGTSAQSVVTGIGVCTPWGGVPLPAHRSEVVDDAWFDTARELGPRGFKYLPPACLYLLAAGRRALKAAGLAGPAGAADPAWWAAPADRGVVIGTNHATSALHDQMNKTVLADRTRELSPAVAPYFAVNVFASRLAIAHECKAFCLTVTTPHTAGMESLQAAQRALALGRAAVVLAGAAEAAVGDTGDAVTEPGAAVFVLEPRQAAADRGAAVLGTCQTRSTAPARDDERLPVTLFADDSKRAHEFERRLSATGFEVDLLPLRAGCTGPAWHVAGLLGSRGEPRVVAVAGRSGTVSWTTVRPAGGAA